MLLLDQLEEVFTQCQGSDERQRYFSHLLDAITDPAPHGYLLLTLRSDFLAESQSHPAFNQALCRHTCLVPVLDDAGLRRAIAEPARRAGHPLDDGVVQLLMEQSADREGALPLLQHALTEIWQGLQHRRPAAQTLHAIGGVGGTLAGRAQAIYRQLSPAEQTIARRAFLKLVQLGEGGADTRRRVVLTDLVAQGETPEAVRGVLHCFADRHTRFLTFLTFEQEADRRESVEITHDALIVHWDELREWLKASRDDLRLLNRLEVAAKHWDTADRARGLLWRRPDLDLLRTLAAHRQADFTNVQADFYRAAIAEERRAVWIKRIAVAALSLLTVTAVLQWNQAERERNRAEKAREVATLARGQAEGLIEHILFDLRDRLAPIGRLDLLEQAAQGALNYYNQQPDSEMTPDALRRRGVALSNIGDVRQAQGDLAGALTAYQAGLAIRQRLAQQDPANAEWQRDLAVSHLKIGDVLARTGKPMDAKLSLKQAQGILEKLVAAMPDWATLSKDLTWVKNRLQELK